MLSQSMLRRIFKWPLIAAFLIGLLISLPLNGIKFYEELSALIVQSHPVRAGQDGLINPLIGFQVSDNKADFKELKPLTDQLQGLIADGINQHAADQVAVYYRNLTNAHWTGINEDVLYSPASLIKVPLMMAYFKLAQSQPELLAKKIVYRSTVDENSIQNVKPNEALVRGRSYTIESLIEIMILYSDNNAFATLFENIDPNDIGDVFNDIGVKLPPNYAELEDFMSPRTFSSFLRVLYNATYLDRDYSKKALDLLARTQFKEGLTAGLPANVTIAEKFGERSVLRPNGEAVFRELHNCGIIYLAHPYVLCVMTKGQDFSGLETVIKDISTTVYNFAK